MKKLLTFVFISIVLSACGLNYQDAPTMDTGPTVLPSHISEPLSLATVARSTPFPQSNPTATHTLLPSSTSPEICGQSKNDRVYLDEHPTFAIRQGPGCEYDVIQEEVTRPDPLRYFDVLGKQGDWLLVDLCNSLEGWVFAPSIAGLNLDVDMDVLPVLTPPATPAILQTMLPANQASLDQAKRTLVAFFELLYDKNYEEAAKIFGGGYGIAIMWNPDVDPDDHPTLLMRACEWNGFQCFVRVDRIANAAQISPMEYRFTVEFVNEDGTLYQRRDAQGNKVSQFIFKVVRDCNGKYLVVTWPFYEQYGV